jgi:hypothetical protein
MAIIVFGIQLVDVVSWLPNILKHVGFPNQTKDVHLFLLQLAWLHDC